MSASTRAEAIAAGRYSYELGGEEITSERAAELIVSDAAETA